jgi:putative ubiquitin-RnfH superfamily antitoxin RatB of RatAB toxin-antitoxin module
MSKRCRVLCDTEQGIRECEVEVPEAANIADVLEAARPLLPDVSMGWDDAAAGIFGQVRERHFVPLDGDRIELYRPLLIDPRQRRRDRAAKRAPRRLD